ncbi:Hypothetical predicted protein [Octopus vulgaris]|uniref:Uncharacterized protein n=1 Tax=Octopus vulgaris TaxID=6645 RepID=A0AA36B263_OCTVU|nr:Hypothetical predicted protein [Octopus vulgaris]
MDNARNLCNGNTGTEAQRNADRLMRLEIRAMKRPEDSEARRNENRITTQYTRAMERPRKREARRIENRLKTQKSRAMETRQETGAQTNNDRLRKQDSRKKVPATNSAATNKQPVMRPIETLKGDWNVLLKENDRSKNITEWDFYPYRLQVRKDEFNGMMEVWEYRHDGSTLLGILVKEIAHGAYFVVLVFILSFIYAKPPDDRYRLVCDRIGNFGVIYGDGVDGGLELVALFVELVITDSVLRYSSR